MAPQGQPWDLYNIQDDRAEQKNLTESRADLAAELAAAWESKTRDFIDLHNRETDKP